MSTIATRRMTLRVYRVRADGSRIEDLSMTVIREDDDIAPWMSSTWPPCSCARCIEAERGTA